MSQNIIAICLYIGIFLMAGTVLVLTVIYFIRPPSTRTGHAVKSDITQTKEIPLEKVRVKKLGSVKTFMSGLKIKKFKGKGSVVDSKQIDDKNKAAAPNIGSKQPQNVEKVVLPAIKLTKPENKVVTAEKQTGEVRPENNDEAPKAADVKTEQEPNTNTAPPSVGVKNEKHDQVLPKPVPKVEIVKPAQNQPPKPASDIVKPEPDNEKHGSNEKDKPAAVEAIKKEPELKKKEPEPKMDIKNVKSQTNITSEKSKIEPEKNKPDTPTITVVNGKKGTEQKSSLDDFSNMFSKEIADDSEATKLAKDLKDVEITSLVKDGQDLINLLKRNRS